MAKFLFELSEANKLLLEEHRKRLGAKSLGEALNMLISAIPLQGPQNAIVRHFSPETEVALDEVGRIVTELANMKAEDKPGKSAWDGLQFGPKRPSAGSMFKTGKKK